MCTAKDIDSHHLLRTKPQDTKSRKQGHEREIGMPAVETGHWTSECSRKKPRQKLKVLSAQESGSEEDGGGLRIMVQTANYSYSPRVSGKINIEGTSFDFAGGY